jgi:chromosome segregation ATPase
MDVRLKWVDQTLASQKGQIENLKKNLAEVEGELSDELAERMWAINSRLKWIDGAISKIKTQKADIVEVEANYEAIQGELLGLADDILELAVAIQKNSEEIALTNAGLRKASSDLTQKIDTEKADIQSQIDSMRARLEASISTNRQMIDSNSRKINDLESRVKTLEDTVFKKPENAQPFGIVLLFAGVAALALLFANQ